MNSKNVAILKIKLVVVIILFPYLSFAQSDKNESDTLEYEMWGVLRQYAMKNGEAEGQAIFWDLEKKKIMEKGFFVKGKAVGLWTVYYSDGKMREKYYCKDGKIEGNDSTFYESGHIESITQFKHGAVLGEFKAYYRSGKIMTEGYYNDSIGNDSTDFNTGFFDSLYTRAGAIGKWVDYYESGQIKCIRFYSGKEVVRYYSAEDPEDPSIGYDKVDSCPTGEWLYFNEKNVIVKRLNYKDCKEVR